MPRWRCSPCARRAGRQQRQAKPGKAQGRKKRRLNSGAAAAAALLLEGEQEQSEEEEEEEGGASGSADSDDGEEGSDGEEEEDGSGEQGQWQQGEGCQGLQADQVVCRVEALACADCAGKGSAFLWRKCLSRGDPQPRLSPATEQEAVCPPLLTQAVLASRSSASCAGSKGKRALKALTITPQQCLPYT